MRKKRRRRICTMMLVRSANPRLVAPAKAGVHVSARQCAALEEWVPAFAGTTICGTGARLSASIAKIPHVMQKQRRGVGEAVDTVEHAAMAGQELARILQAEIALQRRDRDVADEAGDTEKGAQDRGVAQIDRREPGTECCGERRRHEHAAQESLPRL